MSRGPEAVSLDLSQHEQGEIKLLLRRHGTGQALVESLRIILSCAELVATNLGVATALKVSIHPVKDAGATVSAGADHFPPYGPRSALSARRSHRW